MPEVLFLSGVARSGTSALVNLCNVHPRMLIGQERYFYLFRKNLIAPGHFEKGRFLDVQPGDTHAQAGLKLGRGDPGARFDQARWVGDKYPPLFRHFDHVLAAFPAARYLYILRNPLSVIESYDARHRNPGDNWAHSWQDGLADWNESVARVAALPADRLRQFVLVQYEDLYGSVDAMNQLFARLDLPPLPQARLAPFAEKFAGLRDKPVARRDDLRAAVARRADWAAYGRLCDLIDAGGAG
jgi:hypothetical protein